MFLSTFKVIIVEHVYKSWVALVSSVLSNTINYFFPKIFREK